ncbi:type II toxin-antitoxin system RelE/ParE family toxin [Cupriavidus laharis]|uniref:type II toxin-antitoxin system RelE/ParE family toxin n=1 Tax=Cupriavidus laharis TaxID=151654 RepID=UPI0020974C9D|nr:type II toxin-antitoxin system RelE/ParE family toxin [Cupriavidus laharis]
MRELEWKKLARRDLLRIVRKIGEDNPDAAEAFAEMVDAKALALPERPEMYRASKRVPNTCRDGCSSQLHHLLPRERPAS